MSKHNGHDKHPICERLRRIFVGRQITWGELSRRSGLSEGHLWTIFHGDIISPRYSTVVKIVDALDVGEISIVEQEQRRASVVKLRGVARR